MISPNLNLVNNRPREIAHMSKGIEETKEALVALNEVSLKLIKVFGDGFQVSDVGAILELVMGDSEVKSAVVKAFEGYKAVPEELKDVSVLEASELLVLQAGYLPKIVDALKD
jgi:hypothetical protein